MRDCMRARSPSPSVELEKEEGAIGFFLARDGGGREGGEVTSAVNKEMNEMNEVQQQLYDMFYYVSFSFIPPDFFLELWFQI